MQPDDISLPGQFVANTEKNKPWHQSIFLRFLQVGSLPTDDIDARLKKAMFVLFTGFFALAGLLWGMMYFSVGASTSGWIPFLYGIFGVLGTVLFGFIRSFRLYRNSQLLLTLLLPYILMFSLGGFFQGSAVIIWGLTSPMGAMLFAGPRSAIRWFAAYIFLLVLSGLAPPDAPVDAPLSSGLVTTFFVLNLAAVSSLVFVMVYYFVEKKNEFQDQSEALLLNILPKAIADELKGDHHTIAEHFDGASILFADVVDFTPMSSEMSPGELVSLLNGVFSEFDEMVEACGLEKIKTIGDCYMVAAGVPVRRLDHAAVLTELALEMQRCVKKMSFGGRKLQFRIGINSGPLVAGVIGKRKFIYDLWGDAVNMASRMESQGKRGCIQVTRDTKELIEDIYLCEPRGTIDIKGKGPTETWFVTGHKAS